MSSNQSATKGITKSDSERLQDHDDAGDVLALAAFSEAMDSASKSEDEGHDAHATAKCCFRIPAKDHGQHQADHAVMKEDNTGKEEQPAALNMRTVRPGAGRSLGRGVSQPRRPSYQILVPGINTEKPPPGGHISDDEAPGSTL